MQIRLGSKIRNFIKRFRKKESPEYFRFNITLMDNATVDADKVITSDTYKFVEDMDEIPSPYLNGMMDEFFEENLMQRSITGG